MNLCLKTITLGYVIIMAAEQAAFVNAQPFDYALFELPVLSEQDPHTWTRAINNNGEIVGASNLSSGGRHAVVWDSEYNIHDLGVIDGSYSEALDINNLGDIVGYSNWLPDQSYQLKHAFLWRDGTMIDLGTLGGDYSIANAINDLGIVVGQAGSEFGYVAFVWENGVMTALPGLDTPKGQAYDVNNKNQIVGKASADMKSVAVLWQDGEITTLPSLDGGFSTAFAINDLSQIVGQSDAEFSGVVHAVAWVDGQIHDLHSNKAGKSSSAWGINNVGQAVGWAHIPPINQWGFLWDKETGMRRLNDLVPPKLVHGWKISMAHDINDLGQIAAYGVAQNHPLIFHAFLISPVYPSFDLSLATPGIGGEVNKITASNLTPGTKVFFTWGRHGGGAMIPGCSVQTNALQINKPKITGSAIADENGIATLEGLVPVGISNQWLLFQAVVPGDCAVSNLVVQKFE